MTCIVGIIQNKKAYIGADSAGVAGLNVIVRKDVKVFKVGEFIIGGTSSFRMLQLLRFSFSPPVKHDDVDIYKYMCTSFVNEIRNCFKSGGYAETDKGQESGGTFLVAWRDRLFIICDDYQVGEANDNFASCGCGRDYALAALDTIQKINPEMPANEKINMALSIAEYRSGGVRGPFIVETN